MNTIAKLITDDFFLLILNVSDKKETRFSNTAITVEKLANVINKKNNVPQILPPAIFTNTFGNASKISAGP